MALIRIALLLAAAGLSSGCLRAIYTLNVRPDGSGTIVQTMGMSKAALATAMGALASAFDAPDAKTGDLGPIPFFSEQDLKGAAAAMGQGVRLVSVTPVADEGIEGQTATFAFDDIRQLKFNLMSVFGALEQKAGKALPAGADIGVRFERESGQSILVLTMPDIGEAAKAQGIQRPKRETGGEKVMDIPDMPPEVAKMVQEAFADFFVEIAVNVEGRILSTDAPFVDGTKITLMQMDFAEILKTAKGLQEISAKLDAVPGDLGEMFELPGLKIAALPQIRIAFR